MKGAPFIKMSTKQRIFGFVLTLLIAGCGGSLLACGVGMSIDIFRCGWRIQSFEYYSAAVACLIAGGCAVAVAAVFWRLCRKGRF